MIRVRPAGRRDAEPWAAMRHALWPHANRDELRREVDAFFEHANAFITAAFIARNDERTPLGFIELNVRPYAEGAESSPVPHVEGWYVVPTARRTGVGTALMRAAEHWSLQNGFTELTSDTTENYPLSYAAHTANGFEEIERLIAFRKKLR